MDHLTTLQPDELFAELERLQSENRALTAETLALRRAYEDTRLDAERYRLITANTVDLIGEVSQHGVYTYVSANHEALLGYPARLLLGRNFVTLVHPEDMDAVVEKFSACIVEGLPFAAAFRLRHGNGTWRWLEASGTPLETPSAPGIIPYEGQAIFVYRDVTERREARRALATESERLSVTLASIADGVISTDLIGAVVQVNEAALSLLGIRREEITGHSVDDFMEFLEEAGRSAIRSPVIRALTEGVPCPLPLSGHTLVRVHGGGPEFAVAGAATPIRDQDGLILGAVLIFRNITERRRTEQELLKLSKQESLGQLAARIAHDFNNLLTVIMGNLSLTKILLAPGDAALRRLVDTEKACLRAKDLTRQLLAFARGGTPVRRPLALEPLVRESTRLILQDTGGYRLHWPGPLPLVNADAEQLHQLIYELLTNARHASPGGAEIHVRGEAVHLTDDSTLPLPAGEYVRLSVRDEGLGIPETHLTRIFEPFFTTKENARGLGLATCFLIARNHEGFMTVDSVPGFGSTFYLYLPALPDASPTMPAPLEPPMSVRPMPEVGGGNDPIYAPILPPPLPDDARRVLVMDDEAPICELAVELLGREGYYVGTAGDGREAIRCYVQAREKGKPYDVVILDLTVRDGMGGRETVKELKKIDPDVRAIVSSGYSQDPTISRFREFGFCGVVSKPYSVTELAQEVAQAIASPGSGGSTGTK